MIKKLIKRFIPACFLLLGVFASCTSENEPDSTAPISGISLRLQTSAGSTRSSVDTGTEAENRINNVHLWFFASDALDTDTALFYRSELPTSAGSELVLNYTDEVLRLHNMNSEGSYRVFAAANLLADVTAGKNSTLKELQDYIYSASSRPLTTSLCMTGSSKGVHHFGQDSRIDIDLIRVVSKMDVKLVNQTGKSLKINEVRMEEDRAGVQLFTDVPSSSHPGAFTDAYPIGFGGGSGFTMNDGDEKKDSAYVYENRSTNAVKVVIEGELEGIARTWTAEIKPDGVATILRNTIYGVTIKLKKVTPVDITYSIEEWKDTPIDNSLDETFVNLSSDTITLNEVGEGSIYISSNADSIKVDLGASKLIVIGFQNEDIVYLKPVESQSYRLQVVMSELSENEYEDIISITANNLIYQIPVKKEVSISKFHYTLENSNHTALPWYVSSDRNGSLKLTLDRNIPAHYTVQKTSIATYEGKEYVVTEAKQYYGIQYPPEYDPDIIYIPLEENKQTNTRFIFDIEIGILSFTFGIPIAKYTYTVAAYDPNLQP